MKPNFLLCSIFILSVMTTGTAQMVVTDVGANVKMTQQISMAAEQLSTTQKVVQNSSEVLALTRETREQLEKVSSVLVNGKMALSTLENFQQCYDVIKKAGDKVQALEKNNLLVKDGMKRHAQRTGSLLDQLMTYMQFLQSLMKNNTLKMDDGKRSDLLLKMYEKSIELQEKSGELYQSTSSLLDRGKM